MAVSKLNSNTSNMEIENKKFSFENKPGHKRNSSHPILFGLKLKKYFNEFQHAIANFNI